MVIIECRMALMGVALLSPYTTFDGLLAGLAYRLEGPESVDKTGIATIEGQPAASVWFPEGALVTVTQPLMRAYRTSDYARARVPHRFPDARGLTKNLWTIQTGFVTPAITFRAAIDNLERVTWLLSHLTHVGKKIVMGYGHITEKTVTPLEAPWTWRTEQGPIRPLPVEWKQEGDRVAALALRPPYWGGHEEPAVTPWVPLRRLIRPFPSRQERQKERSVSIP